MNKYIYIFISCFTFQSFIFGMDAMNEKSQQLFHTVRDNFNLACSCCEIGKDFIRQSDNLDQDYIKGSLAYYAKTARAAAQDSNKVVDQAIAHHDAISKSRPHSKEASDALKILIDAKYYAKHTHRMAKKTAQLLHIKK